MQSNHNLIPPNHPLNNIEPRPDNKHRGSKRHLLSTVAMVIAAPIIALIMVTNVFQVYEVDGQSMESTLSDGDRLIVLKTPVTWSEITNEPYIPGRYDIVVFNHKSSLDEIYEERQLIKRVIGLPGDRVVISDGSTLVYNSQYPDGYQVDAHNPVAAHIDTTPGNVDITVPQNEIFVLGDNRNNSSDSKVFGTVPVEQVVGKLSLRFYPFDQTTTSF